jgi:acyl-CoA synthetase (AMP-forming)/AMP-acid ligase II
MARVTTPGTLIDLLETGAASHPAIVVPGGPMVTYESLRRQVSGLADQLHAMGIGRGDRVAIVLPNGIETIVSFLAVASVATAAPLNPAYKGSEFKFYIEDTGAKALITSDQVGEAARDVTSEGVIQLRVAVDSTGEMSLSPAPGPDGETAIQRSGPEDVALVLHTSGTTSRPKRVPLAHGNLTVSARNIIETYSLTARDVSLCVMPLFHIHGIVASTLSTLLSGGTVVVPPRFNALGFWPLVREHGVTWFSAVPSMFHVLLGRAGRGRGEAAKASAESLRFIRSCSAALQASTMREMEEQFGAPLLEAYGMTEAAHQMASNPLPPAERFPGAVGFGTGVRIGIMDESGKLLEPQARGEVVIQGPNVINGYEDNPEANASSFTDGWFRTGDQGYLDESECLFLVGRLKELINRSGEKISPVEIDDVLLSHPAVSEAVAFAVPHPVHGEEPTAAVVLDGDATEKELISHCRAHLAAFKCPRTIHIVEAIPRTATGKVQRRIVAATIAGEPAS